MSLSKIVSSPSGGTNGRTAYRVEGVLSTKDGPAPTRIEMTIETEDDESTQLVAVESSGAFQLTSDDPLKRLIVDKYSRSARANGGRFDLPYFMHDPGIPGIRRGGPLKRTATVGMERSLKPDLKVGPEAAFGGERPLKRPAVNRRACDAETESLRGHPGIPG